MMKEIGLNSYKTFGVKITGSFKPGYSTEFFNYFKGIAIIRESPEIIIAISH